MAIKKNPITNSSRGKKPVTSTIETISNAVRSVNDTVQSVTQNTQVITSNLGSIKDAFKQSSPIASQASKDSFTQASELAREFGLEPIDIKSMIGSDPYRADGNIPLMSAREANEQKLKCQQQKNTIEAGLSKLDLNRTVIKYAKAQADFIGDVVDYSTSRINVASKMVDNQIATTNYEIKQSRLIQTEELLNQQKVSTQGTIDLTEGLRQEWVLKLEKQKERNQQLRLEVEGAKQNNEIMRQQFEAQIMEA
jgi:hypothetical protein